MLGTVLIASISDLPDPSIISLGPALGSFLAEAYCRLSRVHPDARPARVFAGTFWGMGIALLLYMTWVLTEVYR